MSSKNKIVTTLKNARASLFESYPIKTLAVFGSVAREDDIDGSDIDILVEFKKPVGMEFIHLSYELERLLQKKVDLVSRNGIKDKYYNEIETELIYV
jgi:predicted nucleotidyltransferase